MTDRNQRQRDLLRVKRQDPEYLAREKVRHAAAMRAKRRARKAAGLCKDCVEPAAPDRSLCARHLALMAARQKGRKRRRGAQGQSALRRNACGLNVAQ